MRDSMRERKQNETFLAAWHFAFQFQLELTVDLHRSVHCLGYRFAFLILHTIKIRRQ